MVIYFYTLVTLPLHRHANPFAIGSSPSNGVLSFWTACVRTSICHFSRDCPRRMHVSHFQHHTCMCGAVAVWIFIDWYHHQCLIPAHAGVFSLSYLVAGSFHISRDCPRITHISCSQHRTDVCGAVSVWISWIDAIIISALSLFVPECFHYLMLW